ncbi:hypothetical protein [Sorangium sp. So ce388]|uniref:hypothetical protein n=1 Tax=Sorangium sp. So ce388 TaxID=3133309 RepID=UPI003F5BD360
MSDPTERARALLQAAREDRLAPSDKARLRAALAVKLAAAAPAPPGEAPPAPPGEAPPAPAPPPPAGAGAGGGALPGKAAGGLLSGKALAAGALIGAVAFAGGFFTGRASIEAPPTAGAAPPAKVVVAPPPAPATPPGAGPEPASAAPPEPAGAAPQAALSAPPGPSRPPEPTSPDVPPAPADAVARAPTAPAARARGGPSAGPSTLAAELALLREAQDAVRDGDPAAALARLDELGARFPEGQLREERMAARVLALCAAGRAREARAEAERLLGDAPGSVHIERIRASCAFRENLD